MPADLRINTSLDANLELERLLARQADIQAQIAQIQNSKVSTTSPSYQQQQQHRVQKHHRRSSNVPRSMSSTGPPMARHLSSDRIELPSQRARTLSQRSAPMARTNSKGTSSARSGNLPFTQNGPMPPPPLRSDTRDNPAMETWMKDESLSSYNFTHQPAPLHRTTSQRRHELEQVPELFGENPMDFISRTMGTPTVSLSPPFSTPSSATLNNNHMNGSFNIAAPSTPTTDSLTTATTLPSSMSRENSLYNEPVVGSFQMMKFNSNTSNNSYSHDVNSFDHTMHDQFPLNFVPSHHNHRSSDEEQSQLLVGAGGVSLDSQFSLSYSSADAFRSSSFGEKMEKSQSNESTSSTSSSTRNKQRLQATLATRKIMPKGGSEEDSMSRANSSQSMGRMQSRDGLQEKVAISNKPSYQRPKHDRVYCKQCESHPDGFRGEHELRRHQDREHRPLVKKWVCIEPTGQGHPKPELPLSKCKSCGIQRKRYGAYYNAAAHLRRTHFKPKAKGRNKSAKVDDVEKRGGKGGGDWPPMSELKFWMKEVEEPATEYSVTGSQHDEMDASDDEANDDTSFGDQYFPSQTLSNMSNFNDALLSDSSPLLNNFSQSNNSVYSMHNMQNMPLDLSSQQSSVDSSMYSHNNFPSFSSGMTNESMPFFDPSIIPQSFDDQAFPDTDFVNFSFNPQ